MKKNILCLEHVKGKQHSPVNKPQSVEVDVEAAKRVCVSVHECVSGVCTNVYMSKKE